MNNKNETLTQDEIQLLEKATMEIFSGNGSWTFHCFQKPKDCTTQNLPCNLRDRLGLAKILSSREELQSIQFQKNLHFVETSDFFEEQRHAYEQRIVEWQIKFMLNGGEGWIIDSQYGGNITFLTPFCDLGFRKGVVDTLTAIGMDTQAIEEGIERNASLWRNLLMGCAYDNQFDSREYRISEEDSEENDLTPVDPEHKEKWLKMRMHEYYLEHKDSVDLYGTIEPGMIMSDEELIEISAYLSAESVRRTRKAITTRDLGELQNRNSNAQETLIRMETEVFGDVVKEQTEE